MNVMERPDCSEKPLAGAGGDRPLIGARYWVTAIRCTMWMLICTTPTAFAQSPSCALFKHGTFSLPGEQRGETMRIVRRGSKQTEHAPEGYRSITRVKWIDLCTYQLYDRKVKGGKDPHPGSPSDTLTIRIIDTWEFGYSFRATSNFSDLEVVGTMELVQPKLGGVSFGP